MGNEKIFDNPRYDHKIGDTIRRLREREGLTLQQVADHLAVHKSTLSKIENNKQSATPVMLWRLANILGTHPGDFFSNTELGPDVQGTVPLVSWVQAGQMQAVIDNNPPGVGERIATTYRVRLHTYALRVRGDSMEPKFPEGAILIVEPDESPEPGAFVIVRQNGDEATFKQLMQDGGRRYLKPLNPRYPILELAPDAVFCGVVKRMEMDV